MEAAALAAIGNSGPILVGTVASFTLYKIFPVTYDIGSSYFGDRNYQTVEISISQNADMVKKMAVYLSKIAPEGASYARPKIDGKSYKVPNSLIYFKDPNSHYWYYIKANISNGTITSIVLSTYKKRWNGRKSWWGMVTGWHLNEECIAAFDKFIESFE